MSEQVPHQYIMPKLPPYTGTSDPEAHLKAFRAQILISGGSDAIKCKVFVGTLAHGALKWFGGIQKGTITSFPVFTRLFIERFAANRAKPPRITYLFDIRQGSNEPLREYINRFCDASTSISNSDEEILVDAFLKGLRANSFSDSLVRNLAISLAEIRVRASIHIEADDVMRHKRRQERRSEGDAKTKAPRKRYDDADKARQPDWRYAPYIAQTSIINRTGRSSGNFRPQLQLKSTKIDVLKDVDVNVHLRFPEPTTRTLGRDQKTWCEFHQAWGHDTERCFTLTEQLLRLKDKGYLDKHL